MRMLKEIIRKMPGAIALIMVLAAATLQAEAYEARIHCQEDTVAVSRLLREISAKGGDFGSRCVTAARLLEGTPWAQPADNDEKGTIVINLHGFDRMGFVNTVMALAAAAGQKLPNVKQYEHFYEQFSRRRGQDDGFPSRLYYGAEWVVDNIYRGNLKEMTEYVSGGSFKTKTLDYMTRHKDEFPAMKDDAVSDKVRMNEMGYRSHRIPHLKKQSVGNKPLHELMDDGDIIMMLSPEPDRDLYDIGFVELKEGEPYLIHISYDNGKVVADPYPLARLFKLESQHFYGYRWLRPQE